MTVTGTNYFFPFIFSSSLEISDISFHSAEILAYLIGSGNFWVWIDSESQDYIEYNNKSVNK